MPRAATLALLTAIAASAAGASASAATPEDRYGPPSPTDPAAPVAGPVSGWLSWSNKTPPPAPAQPVFQAAPRPYAVEAPPAPWDDRAPRPHPVARTDLPTSLYGSYPSLSPRDARVENAPPRQPTFESEPRRQLARDSDAPPPRWTPQNRSAVTPEPPAAPATGQPPHFYSVHRQFGLTPDPIPLPPQFFADSADFSAPPAPLPPRPVPGSQAATSPSNTPANRARAVALDTADSAAN